MSSCCSSCPYTLTLRPCSIRASTDDDGDDDKKRGFLLFLLLLLLLFMMRRQGMEGSSRWRKRRRRVWRVDAVVITTTMRKIASQVFSHPLSLSLSLSLSLFLSCIWYDEIGEGFEFLFYFFVVVALSERVWETRERENMREREGEETDIGLDFESIYRSGSKSRRSALSAANTYRLLSEKNRIDPSCLSVSDYNKFGEGKGIL